MQEIPPKLDYAEKEKNLPSWVWPVIAGAGLFLAVVLFLLLFFYDRAR